MTQAQNVADLSPATHQMIADELSGVDDAITARHILARHLGGPKKARHLHANDAAVAFCRTMQRGLTDLEGRIDKVSPIILSDHLPALLKAAELLKVWLPRAELAGNSSTFLDRKDRPRRNP